MGRLDRGIFYMNGRIRWREMPVLKGLAEAVDLL